MGSQVALTLVSNDADVSSRRGCLRHRALLLAKLVTTTNEYPVRLRDLSVGGALIEGEGIPQPGTDIILRRGRLEVLATIKWHRGNLAGVEFETPLTDGEVWSQINPGTPPPVADVTVYRPGFRGDQVQAEERALIRAKQIAARRLFAS